MFKKLAISNSFNICTTVSSRIFFVLEATQTNIPILGQNNYTTSKGNHSVHLVVIKVTADRPFIPPR